MNPRQHITTLLRDWLELTHRESHAIQVGRWLELAEIQKTKAAMQKPLADAINRWKAENPSESVSHPFRDEVNRLLDLESHNSELLALRKREVREKILLLEQVLDDLRRLRSSYVQSFEPA